MPLDLGIADPTTWPAELRVAMVALARTLQGRQPTADLFRALSAEYAKAIDQHEIRITYRPKGTFDAKKAFYSIAIDGPRLSAQWNFTTRQLCEMLNAAYPGFQVRLS